MSPIGWVATVGSVNSASRQDPFAWLSRDRGDVIEVGVVVDQDERMGFSGGGDEEIGNLSTFEAGSGEPLLNLACPVEVMGLDVNSFERFER